MAIIIFDFLECAQWVYVFEIDFYNYCKLRVECKCYFLIHMYLSYNMLRSVALCLLHLKRVKIVVFDT